MRYRHLFGPVPSRRLGVSLGIDLVPLKTCTLNCIYCECGETNNCTLERKEYVPLEEVYEELNDYLSKKPALDYITFSGSGEPTLHSGIGDVVKFLKQKYPAYRLCLLTNSTLLNDDRVREQIKPIDLIVPSLDTATEECFQSLNRPCGGLRCEDIIEGLVALRREYAGEIHLEIFVAPGLNDTPEELAALKAAIERIKPDRIQLGTLDRPGTEEWLEPADYNTMQGMAAYLGNAEIIGEFRPGPKITSFDDSHSRQIYETLKRRPCTVADLKALLNLRPAEIQKYINHLLGQGKIEIDHRERGAFLKVKKNHGRQT